VTFPPPVTVTVKDCVAVLPDPEKVAVTDWEEFIVTVQVAVPLHPPPQPEKVAPELGASVRMTGVPGA
jgi:hypothetical protein